jgi:hypothetical protein
VAQPLGRWNGLWSCEVAIGSDDMGQPFSIDFWLKRSSVQTEPVSEFADTREEAEDLARRVIAAGQFGRAIVHQRDAPWKQILDLPDDKPS